MVEGGMPAMETIQAATITNAHLLELSDKIGRIEKAYWPILLLRMTIQLKTKKP